jgi:RimJ/RimL family protein N-acetyltransferase
MDRTEMDLLPVGDPVPGEPARGPDRSPMLGRYVSLVPVDAGAHAAALFRATEGPDGETVWTYMPYGPFADEDEMAAWLATIAPSTDPMFFAVVERATDQPVGVVSYLNIVPLDRRIELGHIWYAPEAQRGRANTEVAFLLLGRAFDDLGYRRAEWKCDAMNARSRAAAHRLGFTFEGIFRHHMVVKGRNRDTAWFSMLDEEWPARKAAMRRWLDAPDGTVSLRELTAALSPEGPTASRR